MADDGSKQDANIWPLPKFYFELALGDLVMQFQEASGLDDGAPVVEYRGGHSPAFAVQKMPGLKKTSPVSLKRGLLKGGGAAWVVLENSLLKNLRHDSATLRLLGQDGKTTVEWTLRRVTVNKLLSVDLKSTGNEVAMESLELVCEGMEMRTSR